MPDLRKLTIPAAVTLPALSTSALARPYSFASFVSEFILRAPGMQSEARLDALLDEWEPLYEAHIAPVMMEMAGDLGKICLPKAPGANPTDEQVAQFRASLALAGEAEGAVREAYELRLSESLAGTSWKLSESAWQAAVDSSKEAIDAAQVQDGRGQQKIAPDYIRKILRHFQSLKRAEKVKE